MNYLAVCCIAKDENINIKEWLAYHAAIGVEHFYIYDNMSAAPIADFIKDFANESQVTCARINGQGVQMEAYGACLGNYGAENRWIAFIDLDEFICPYNVDDLRPFLADYEQYGAVALNWKNFSSSGHLSRPSGLVVENYTQHIHNSNANLIIKCIVQPRRVKYVVNPHIFGYHDGFFAVNADCIPVPKHTSRCMRASGKAFVHHYQYKSQQDFEDKQKRGRGDVPRGVNDFPYSGFYRQAAEPWKEERAALRFAPQVKEMLQKNRLVMRLPSYNIDELIDKLAEVLIKDNEDSNATETYLCHAAMHYEDEPAVWFGRAYLWHQRGNLEKALRFAELGLKSKPDGRLFEEYFYLSAALEKYEQAAAALEYVECMIEGGDDESAESVKKMKEFLTSRLRGAKRRG